MHSNDDGISLLLAMVPNLCIDKKLGFDSPRCAVSFPRIGIGQMDSKQKFFAPSDVQVNLQCAMLISSAAYTHSMTKVAVQLFVRRFGPDRSSDADWAEARVKIARMTLTIKLDGNWSSFQLANSAPPLSVTDSAIAPSARSIYPVCRVTGTIIR